jgi:hypothetical protein
MAKVRCTRGYIFQKERTVNGGELHIRKASRLGMLGNNEGTALCGVRVSGIQESKEARVDIEEIESNCLSIARRKGTLILA